MKRSYDSRFKTQTADTENLVIFLFLIQIFYMIFLVDLAKSLSLLQINQLGDTLPAVNLVFFSKCFENTVQ